VAKIVIGFVLDLIFGDPYYAPHPVKFIGKLIGYLEKLLIKLHNKKLSGFLLTCIVVVSIYLVTASLCSLNIVIEIFLIYTIFAVKSLGREGKKIYRLLEKGDISEARIQLGFIVSRDTSELGEKDIIRSTIETIAENIVDGVISPIFYLLLGGAPLAMAFKAASTLDSMVGYKNEKYRDFGFASAKLDDILNFIPARITGFILIPIAALLSGKNFLNSLKVVLRDRLNHDSPNSAHSEAAVAGALGVRLGGQNVYFGEVVNKPYIGDKLKDFETNDITGAIAVLYLTAIIALGTGLIIKYLFGGAF
jgi:adenosylcobinamide-phosphate synthase